MPDSHHTTQSMAATASALSRAQGRPLVNRIRFQLGGALLAGVLGPLLVRWPLETLHLEVVTDVWRANSSAAAVLAIILGYTFVRQFIAYPGARATAYILPSLAASYGLVALAFFFTRTEYSRYMFIASFMLSVAWLYVSFFLRNRYARPLLALVPAGNHRGVASILGANWLSLTTPNASLEGVEAVVADLHADLPKAWERFIAQCVLAGIPVYDVKNVIESLTGRVEVERLAENSFGSVLPSRFYLRTKRMLDVLLAILVAPIFLVSIAVAAPLIRLETPGPIFFTQPRMGFRAHIFKIYKLRTMRVEDGTGQHFTSKDDPRVTRVGWYLRKYRIDEFPQILNIIRGEMSWIGPRPEAIELAEWYAKDVPFYIYRHAVRPGISGWAQVNQGNVAEVSAAAVKLQYDFFYIKNFSPWLDILILLKTLRTILTGFGSR